MRRLLCASVLVILAACPKKTPGPTVTTPVPGVGCPSASGVYIATYVQPPQGERGYTGWVLPLHDVKVDSVEGQPSFAPIDAATATAAGVPAPPTTVWVLPPNAAMCKATIGNYYAAAIDEPANIAYGVELSGCPAPQDPSGVAIVLVSEQPPSECKVIPPRPVAARLGEVDKQGQWSRPTKETPIPAALETTIPQKDCVAPDCEKLWSIAQADVDGKPVAWAAAVNWLKIPAGAPPATQCEWPVETFSGFFVAGADGTPVKVTEGQDHPLALTVVLADKQGPRVVLAEGPGEYTAYDLASGLATVGRHVVWLLDQPQAYGAVDRIGPECSP